ncbi:MAG: SUMF1/EgtB/PvdO family nonheme iron enzyme [Phycisphaerales bacterium]|nr:SUMF1/EgtB/PvdO family nonheme iron enzyme [Phycisphaerales bacterium]
MSRNLAAALFAWLVVTVATLAQPGGVPDYGFDWVTIGDVNNPAYTGPGSPDHRNYPVGRGSVGYEYRISRTEITTLQWMEFLNTFITQPGVDAFSRAWQRPLHWGGVPTNNPNGPGILYLLDPLYPRAADQPVAGISWRQAARFCNWLQSGKSSSLDALVTGAYDTTTWSGGPGTGTPATDAERHLPGARFWIPTIDEWIKAAHYDPAKYGAGQGGYWQYPNRSDLAPVPGLPGMGEANIGTEFWEVPVGSYPMTRSAFGLLDLAGGVAEWSEDIFERSQFAYRFADGSSASQAHTPQPNVSSVDELIEHSAYIGGDSNANDAGLRIASIPVPNCG